MCIPHRDFWSSFLTWAHLSRFCNRELVYFEIIASNNGEMLFTESGTALAILLLLTFYFMKNLSNI